MPVDSHREGVVKDCSVNISKLKSLVDRLSKTKILPEPATLPPIKQATNVFTKRKRDTKAESKGIAQIESKH